MPDSPSFSHLDATGAARMVDVGHKPVQARAATAYGELVCQPATLELLHARALPKGDVLAAARLAGILAAKRTDELIPLCHGLPLDSVSVDFTVLADRIQITAMARVSARTGVEMEALVAVTVAGLTLYDMMKAVDKTMVLGAVRVTEKTKS
ncbi:MAG: cyclic pyranopterin monophosphate synthase MoaC [Burkholderiales bacterium]|nr:cyclic pyranopterin monophosphate synthase MoaC [Opitutaceae bacterium]